MLGWSGMSGVCGTPLWRLCSLYTFHSFLVISARLTASMSTHHPAPLLPVRYLCGRVVTRCNFPSPKRAPVWSTLGNHAGSPGRQACTRACISSCIFVGVKIWVVALMGGTVTRGWRAPDYSHIHQAPICSCIHLIVIKLSYKKEMKKSKKE